jgi:putative transposase
MDIEGAEPALARPIPNKVKFEPGLEVAYQGERYAIVEMVDLNRFLVENAVTKARAIVGAGDLSIWITEQQIERRKVPDLSSIPEERRAIGLRRQEVIEGLLKIRHRTKQMVEDAAADLGLASAWLYFLMKRYEQEGTWTCLIPHGEKGKPRKGRLAPEVEAIMDKVIKDHYLKRGKPSKSEVALIVEQQCKAAGFDAPTYNTVRDRIKKQDPRKVTAARYGMKAAREKHDPVLGAADEARWPLQRYQIDHTVADLFVVDEENHLSIARPILTLIIDEFSRCVAGFHLSLRAPSTATVARVIAHALMPKDEYCRRMKLESEWPICGIPDLLLSDNAVEFDSTGAQLGCRQYGLIGQFRPLGRPNFGGHIERLIGTMMGRVRLMPGATMNSIKERGADYDPEKGAALTMAQAEQRIAMEIADRYHREEHAALGVTPLRAYRFGILGDDHTPGRGYPAVPTDAGRLLLDFLPAKRLSIQDYGLQINYTRFYGSILRTMKDRQARGEKHIVRFDPDNFSRVWIYSGVDAEYFEIPRARSQMPQVTLWDVKAAIKRLKEEGRDPKDEDAVYRTIQRGWQMDEAAMLKSKRARLNVERRRLAAKPAVTPSVGPKAPAVADPVTPDESSPSSSWNIQPIADVKPW